MTTTGGRGASSSTGIQAKGRRKPTDAQGQTGGAAVTGVDKRGQLADPRTQIDYPPDEQKALYDYTLSSHINAVLGKAQADGRIDEEGNITYSGDSELESNQAYIETLDRAISKSGWNDIQKNTGLIRGAGAIVVGVPESMSFSSPYELADYINHNRRDTENVNAGYTSITGLNGTAGGFASGQKNPIIIEYGEVSMGVHGAFVSGGKGKKAISFYDESENETILERGIVTMPTSAWVASDGNVHVNVSIWASKADPQFWGD